LIIIDVIISVIILFAQKRQS